MQMRIGLYDFVANLIPSSLFLFLFGYILDISNILGSLGYRGIPPISGEI